MTATRRLVVWVAAFVILLSAGSGLSAVAEQRGRRGGVDLPPIPSGRPAASLTPVLRSQGELNAFRAVETAPDPDSRIIAAEDFLANYPDSELRHVVLRIRWQVFAETGDDVALMAAAEAALEAETVYFESKTALFDDPSDEEDFAGFELEYLTFKSFYLRSLMDASNRIGDSGDTIEYGEQALSAEADAWESYGRENSEGTPEYRDALGRHEATRLGILQTMMTSRQSVDDAPGVIEYARRLLRFDPEDLLTLLTISRVMAERPPEDEQELEAHMDIAEEHAKHAIENVEALLRSPASDQMAEQQKAGLLSSVHGTLGFVYFHQKEYGDAAKEYETALEADRGDAIAHYRLGVTYNNDRKVDPALESLARAVFLGVPLPEVRQILEQVYELKNGSLEGLDEFIENEGQELLEND